LGLHRLALRRLRVLFDRESRSPAVRATAPAAATIAFSGAAVSTAAAPTGDRLQETFTSVPIGS
jgi:hypothetical protein